MPYTIPNCHDSSHTHQPPFLRKDINLISLVGLPSGHRGPRCSFLGMSTASYQQLANDGFTGVQSNVGVFPSTKQCEEIGFGRSIGTLANIKTLEKNARKWKAQGYECATILIGSGRETFAEASALVEEVLAISERTALPIYIELHRGTVTQHIPLVLALIERYPGLRFNGDFSHYVCAYRWDDYFDQTMFDALLPILQRVRFIQARLADHTKAQSHQTDDHAVWPLFQLLWQQSFKHFQETAAAGDYFIFAPELLPRFTDYAEITYSHRGAVETGNRYETAKRLAQSAEQLFSSDGQQEDWLTPSLNVSNRYAADNNYIHIPTLEHIDRLTATTAPQKVILGTGLETEDQARALLAAFDAANVHGQLLLKVHRGSVTQNPFLLVKRLQPFPQIRLIMDIAEWVMAHEMRPDHLPKLTPILKTLASRVAENVPVMSTAERLAIPVQGSGVGALLCIPSFLAAIYRRFYRSAWRG